MLELLAVGMSSSGYRVRHVCSVLHKVELQIGLKDYDTQRDKRFAGTAGQAPETMLGAARLKTHLSEATGRELCFVSFVLWGIFML